jgi:hypothetical protein
LVGSGDNRQGYEINAASPIAIAQIGSLVQTVTFLGILQALGLAIIGGLILNVMPCVLPVISLKIFGFVSEAGQQPDKALRLSMTFSLGILFCFAVLAVLVILLQAAGTQVGWGFQFQDYRFVVVISGLVFAFALNLFGVYELSVSAKATGKLAKLAGGLSRARQVSQNWRLSTVSDCFDDRAGLNLNTDPRIHCNSGPWLQHLEKQTVGFLLLLPDLPCPRAIGRQSEQRGVFRAPAVDGRGGGFAGYLLTWRGIIYRIWS